MCVYIYMYMQSMHFLKFAVSRGSKYCTHFKIRTWKKAPFLENCKKKTQYKEQVKLVFHIWAT